MSLLTAFTKQNSTHIGVEICAQQLRFVVLAKKNQTWRYLEGGMINISHEPLLAWRELSQRCKKYRASITLGVELNKVLIKSYTLEHSCRDDEVIAYLQQHAQTLLKLSVAELALDYEMVRTDQQKQWHIRMVAAKKILLVELIEYCRQAKLRLHAIDIGALTLPNSLAFINGNFNDCAMVIVESDYLIYSVQQAGKLLFLKSIPYSINVPQACPFIENVQMALTQGQHLYLSTQKQSMPVQTIIGGALGRQVIADLRKRNSASNTDYLLAEWDEKKLLAGVTPAAVFVNQPAFLISLSLALRRWQAANMNDYER